MFHTKNQIKKIRESHIGYGVLLYHAGGQEIREIEFNINRTTGRPCSIKTGQDVEFLII